jgi:hypothetical protein
MAIQDLSVREILNRIHATVLAGSVFVQKYNTYNCYPAPYNVKVAVENDDKKYTATIFILDNDPQCDNEIFELEFKNMQQLNTELYLLHAKLREQKIYLTAKYNRIINEFSKGINSDVAVNDPIHIAQRLEGAFLLTKKSEYIGASRYCLFVAEAIKHLNKVNKRSAEKCSS